MSEFLRGRPRQGWPVFNTLPDLRAAKRLVDRQRDGPCQPIRAHFPVFETTKRSLVGVAIGWDRAMVVSVCEVYFDNKTV